jgi:hypothetical protein
MKKLFGVLFIALVLMSLFAFPVVAESGSGSDGSGDSGSDSDNSGSGSDDSSGSDSSGSGDGDRIEVRTETRTKTIVNGEEVEIRERIRVRIESESDEEREKRIEEFRKVIDTNKGEIIIEGRKVTIRFDDGEKEITAGRFRAKTRLNLTSEKEGNKTHLGALLSNGRFALVKVMPDRASETALARLRAKCEENNCSVELKEVGTGNETRAEYEVRTEKRARILGLFRARMEVKARVHAETGEVTDEIKPWWRVFAVEEDEEADDSEGSEEESS